MNSGVTRIAIVGAGLIGQAWSIVFARAGYPVTVWDPQPGAADGALGHIESLARGLQANGLLADAGACLQLISKVDTLEAALDGVEYVQENAPERLDVKRALYARLDAVASPQAILASSTSGLPASAFTEALPGRHRCLVAHPVNPPYLIPVVELCGAPWTSTEVVERARGLLAAVGQCPVTVREELPGFVLNRLQGALLREAFRLVARGAISVEDLDATIKHGLGLRWSFMGPFETIDLNAPGGLADYCGRYGELYRDIAEEQADASPWSGELIEAVVRQRRERLPESQLAVRRQWRDGRLMALMRFKASLEDDPSAVPISGP